MAKSLFTDAHKVLVKVLADARHDAGLHQDQVADRIGKDQSFVSNIERGQRRVDVVEFFAIAKALEVDPILLFRRFVDSMS